MNKSFYYLGIPISIALAFLLLMTTPFAWAGIISSIPLFGIKRYRSLISGLLIGFFAPFSLYLLYPFENVMKLGNIMSGITSLPAFFIILAFPIFSGLITGLSALLWNGLFDLYVARTERKPIRGS